MMSEIKSSFTAVAIDPCGKPYTITDLGVKVRRPKNVNLPEKPAVLKGISFPVGADSTLVGTAEKLVYVLNQAYDPRKEEERTHNAHGSYFLRSLIVESTAILATDFGSSASGKINPKSSATRFCIKVASDLRRVMEGLDCSPDYTLQRVGIVLRDFFELFARTKGASPYTVFALENNASGQRLRTGMSYRFPENLEVSQRTYRPLLW